MPIATKSIAAKEFYPIVLAAIIWGHAWHGSSVLCHCDNRAVVDVINRMSARDPLLCYYSWCLFFVSASAKHTPGIHNSAADALSRNDLSSFLAQIPNASPHPSPIPPDLLWGLCSSQPTWTSQDWTAWFNSCCSIL